MRFDKICDLLNLKIRVKPLRKENNIFRYMINNFWDATSSKHESSVFFNMPWKTIWFHSFTENFLSNHKFHNEHVKTSIAHKLGFNYGSGTPEKLFTLKKDLGTA